jgi:hypothetical protein
MGRRLLMWLMPLVLVLGSLAALPVAAAGATYQDPNGAYNFTLPDGWQAQMTGDGLACGDGVNATAILIGARPANGAALDDAFRQDTATNAKDPNLQASPVTDLTVGGQPAKRMSFKTLDGFPLMPSIITVINNDTIYTIGYLTDNPSVADAALTTIIGSWQFT